MYDSANADKIYFWVNEEVVKVAIDENDETITGGEYSECPYIDCRFSEDDVRRYGMWDCKANPSWVDIPKNKLPTKFLASLLLMGIN